jgi:hypothetical protein
MTIAWQQADLGRPMLEASCVGGSVSFGGQDFRSHAGSASKSPGSGRSAEVTWDFNSYAGFIAVSHRISDPASRLANHWFA